MKKFLEGAIQIPLYATVLLLPLFFLTFTVESYEFNKLYLLFTLVLISLLAWLAKSIFIDREITFKRTPLDIGIGMFLLAAIITTIFAQDLITSLFGFYGRFSGSFIEFILWVLFYLIITNNVSYLDARRLFILFFVSASVLALWFDVNLFSSSLKAIGPLYRIFTLAVTSPLSISPQALAVFESLALVFLLLHWALWFKETSARPKPTSSLGYVVAFLLLFSTLIVVNFAAAWLILFLSLTPFVIWAVKKRVLQGAQLNHLSLAIFTILLSFVYLLFSPSLSSIVSLFSGDLARSLSVPQEITLLRQGPSWSVASRVLTSFPYALVGVGMGNFFSAYSLFRPLIFNQAPEWSFRFDTASSHYANILATMGIIGVLGFLLFAAFTIYLLIKLLGSFAEARKEGAFFAFGFLAILVSMGLYYQTISLAMIFWITLAPLGLLLQRVFPSAQYRYEFRVTPEANLFLTSIFFVGVFVIVLLGYAATRMYLADMASHQGFIAPTLDARVRQFQSAVAFNPLFIQYRIALAQTSLAKATQDVQKAGPQNIQDITPIALLLQQAQAQAQDIINRSPNLVISWEHSAKIYSDLMSFISDKNQRGQLLQLSVQDYDHAALLEPTNPVFPLQVASLLSLNDGDAKKAKASLEQARSLKPDLPDIALSEALILEKQNNLPSALAVLDKALKSRTLSPAGAQEELYQLGRIAFNAGQIQRAIDAFSKVIKLNPNHSGAHYALGLAYERIRETKKARAEYQKALDLNPNNAEVRGRLEALK